MKKKVIFYIIDTLWIIVFFTLAYQVNENESYGLAALTDVGYFVLYSFLFIFGVIVMLIVSGIIIIQWIKRRKFR